MKKTHDVRPAIMPRAGKIEGALKPLEEVNALGRGYAELPDEIPAAGDRLVSNGEKETLLLELCQCFHPYLKKYLVMICLGHMPIVGVADVPARMNKDVCPFVLYLLPKGRDRRTRTCRRSRNS